jgi:hypothetical protein
VGAPELRTTLYLADKSASSGRAAKQSGEGGIRTPDAGITDVTVFETAAFNRSATSPHLSVSTHPPPFNYPLLPILLYCSPRLNLDLHLEENDGSTLISCRSRDVAIAPRR